MRPLLLLTMFAWGCDFGVRRCTNDTGCRPGGVCRDGICLLVVEPQPSDSGVVDSGVVDSGVVDSGAVDSGAVDSGAVDSGAVDSGAVDSGVVDSGPCVSGDVRTTDGGCAPDQDFCERFDGGSWCWEHPLPQGNTLRAAWRAADGGFLWVVGDRGVLLRYNGVEWSNGRSGVRADLFALSGTGPDDVWAAGDAGVLLHFNGKQWSTVIQPSKRYSIHGLWASPGEVVGVGRKTSGEPLVVSYFPLDGGLNDAMLLGTGALEAVSEHAGDLVAVGSIPASAIVFVREGATWSPVSLAQAPGGAVVAPLALATWNGRLVIGVDQRLLSLNDGGLSLVTRIDSSIGTIERLLTLPSGALVVGSDYFKSWLVTADGGVSAVSSCNECPIDHRPLGMAAWDGDAVVTVGPGGRINGTTTSVVVSHPIRINALAELDGTLIAAGGYVERPGASVPAGFVLQKSTDWSPEPFPGAGVLTTALNTENGVIALGSDDGGVWSPAYPMPARTFRGLNAPDASVISVRGLTRFNGSVWAASEVGIFAAGSGGGLTLVSQRSAVDIQSYDAGLFTVDRDGAVCRFEVTAGGQLSTCMSWSTVGAPADWRLLVSDQSAVVAGASLWRARPAAGLNLIRSSFLATAVAGDPEGRWWAVGDRGQVLNCLVDQCERETTPTTNSLRAVLATRDGGVFIGGELGAVLRRFP
jgi:hypothetical protein